MSQLPLDLGDEPSNPKRNRELAKSRPRLPSYRLKPADAAMIKLRVSRGELQSRIAADYDTNIGRVSEIASGKMFKSVPAAPSIDGEMQ